MRRAFVNQLVEEAKHNDKIFLLTGDLGFHALEPFIEAYPDRYLNCGINEQTMVGLATGLAKDGFNVYIYSIANFPSLRCIEQIRYDVAYPKMNVKIVSVGVGFAYSTLGASHQATEDMGMMRTIPNMVVCTPCDPSEAARITSISASYNGPMYMRLGKARENNVFECVENFEIGDIHTYNESTAANALFVSGSITDYTVNWVKDNGVDTAIYSVPFIKPINRELLKDIITRHLNIVVLEEHQLSCGLSSAIIEQVNDMFVAGEIASYPKIHRIGIQDQFLSVSGTTQFLREKAGLVLSSKMFV